MAEENGQPWPEPRANPRLLGHEDAEAALLRAKESGRLPHAWLLTGPRGVGKATLAFRFARFLLAGGGENAAQGAALFGEADLPQTGLALPEESPIFRRVAAGGESDLLTLARGYNDKTKKLRSEIIVEDTRNAIGFLRMTSGGGGYRMLIVDSVDDMGSSAANALLKVLEEPPEQAVLLLISHSPGGLLPTIRSRCRKLRMTGLPEDVLVQLLDDYAPDLGSDEKLALARMSGGSIGRALTLSRNGGLELYQEMIAVLSSLPKLDIPRVYGFGDKLARDQSGDSFRTGGDLLCNWLAELVRSGGAGAEPPDVVVGESELRHRLLAGGGLAQWLALWENLSRLFGRAERANLDRRQVVVSAFLEIEALMA